MKALGIIGIVSSVIIGVFNGLINPRECLAKQVDKRDKIRKNGWLEAW